MSAYTPHDSSFSVLQSQNDMGKMRRRDPITSQQNIEMVPRKGLDYFLKEYGLARKENNNMSYQSPPIRLASDYSIRDSIGREETSMYLQKRAEFTLGSQPKYPEQFAYLYKSEAPPDYEPDIRNSRLVNRNIHSPPIQQPRSRVALYTNHNESVNIDRQRYNSPGIGSTKHDQVSSEIPKNLTFSKYLDKELKFLTKFRKENKTAITSYEKKIEKVHASGGIPVPMLSKNTSMINADDSSGKVLRGRKSKNSPNRNKSKKNELSKGKKKESHISMQSYYEPRQNLYINDDEGNLRDSHKQRDTFDSRLYNSNTFKSRGVDDSLNQWRSRLYERNTSNVDRFSLEARQRDSQMDHNTSKITSLAGERFSSQNKILKPVAIPEDNSKLLAGQESDASLIITPKMTIEAEKLKEYKSSAHEEGSRNYRKINSAKLMEEQQKDLSSMSPIEKRQPELSQEQSDINDRPNSSNRQRPTKSNQKLKDLGSPKLVEVPKDDDDDEALIMCHAPPAKAMKKKPNLSSKPKDKLKKAASSLIDIQQGVEPVEDKDITITSAVQLPIQAPHVIVVGETGGSLSEIFNKRHRRKDTNDKLQTEPSRAERPETSTHTAKPSMDKNPKNTMTDSKVDLRKKMMQYGKTNQASMKNLRKEPTPTEVSMLIKQVDSAKKQLSDVKAKELERMARGIKPKINPKEIREITKRNMQRFSNKKEQLGTPGGDFSRKGSSDKNFADLQQIAQQRREEIISRKNKVQQMDKVIPVLRRN